MARIMVVDDEKNLLESLGRVLTDEGYTVKLASSGAEALRLLEEFKPEALLLDIRMPEMDGLEVCRRIRAHNDRYIKSVPIIVITGYQYEKEEIIKAGADDFLEKPIEKAEMILRLRSALRIGQLTNELERTKAYLEELKRGKV